MVKTHDLLTKPVILDDSALRSGDGRERPMTRPAPMGMSGRSRERTALGGNERSDAAFVQGREALAVPRPSPATAARAGVTPPSYAGSREVLRC